MARFSIDALESRRLFAAAEYTLTLLAPPAGSTASHANAVNAAGMVVGYSSAGTTDTPTQWKPAITAGTKLPLAPDGGWNALDIDDAGDVLYGGSYKRTAAGAFVLLRDVKGAPGSGAAINKNGDIAGRIGDDIVLFKAGGTSQHITVPSGYTSLQLYGINDHDDIVGIALKGTSPVLFLYSAASKSFKTLSIPATAASISQARAVNNSGVAAGFFTPSSHHAATWTNGIVKDLGTLGGEFDFSIGWDINDAGQVVGYDGAGAFVYKNGAMRDLNKLVLLLAGVTLDQAFGINAKGQIVGDAVTPAGRRAFLLTPITSTGGSISGTLFNDTDADGVLDSSESRLSARTVFIDANHNGVLDASEKRTLTDASGNYTFTGLPAGSYRVRRTLPTGYRYTTPTTGFYDLTLASGQKLAGKNFGVTPNILISGSVFNDANGDKLKNSTESGLSAWRVFIDKDNDGVFDAGEASVLTDASGNWSFKTLVAGTYVFRAVQQSGWTRTTPTGGAFSLTISAGGASTGKLFGEKRVA